MGTGKLSVQARTAFETLPVYGAVAEIYEPGGKLLYRLVTDKNGMTESVPLSAPDKSNSLSPEGDMPRYSTVNIVISALNYVTNIIKNVKIYDTVESVMNATMYPLTGERSGAVQALEYNVPPPAVEGELQSGQTGDPPPDPAPAAMREVTLPDYITVHMGAPNAAARNIRVAFPEYIKNVASSEIYPTWPRSALEANIYAIITFALNRVYTEWYRSRGFPFDITSSTAFDMAFVENREIYNSISTVVDEIFNRYARRAGRREPFFTSFCNGTTATCAGLSQWGTVTLANRGMTPLEILHYYYPDDLELVTGRVAPVVASYPGSPLRQGSSGEPVRLMQRYLNRIRADYPLIPQIPNPNGLFGPETTNAVRAFQNVFRLVPDGIIGNSTWNKIWYLFVAVTRLAELDSEGEFISIGQRPPTSVLRQGARGADVSQLQFLLEFISQFFPSVPWVIRDSVFGPTTRDAVMDFQRTFGLVPDGIVGPLTWNRLYEVYRSVNSNVQIPQPPAPSTPPFPGVLLRIGMSGPSIRTLQEFLNAVAAVHPDIPVLAVDGIFGPRTQNSVLIFQRMFGLAQDGIVGPLTWNRLMEVYRETRG